jgi:hypothetical protein
MVKMGELDDEPIEPRKVVPKEPLPGTDDFRKWAEAIEEMSASGKFGWAYDTLADMYDAILEGQWISEGQKKALRNIAEARRWDGLEGLR